MLREGPDPMDVRGATRKVGVVLAEKEELLRYQFDRAAIKDLMIRTWDDIDADATTEVIDDAIDDFLETRNAFKPPKPGLQTYLAHWYVRKGKIGAVAGSLSLAAAATMAGISGINKARLASEEGRVEGLVESAYAQLETYRDTVNRLKRQGGGLISGLPDAERTRFDGLIRLVDIEIESADEFLLERAPGGSAEESVTKTNYSDVETELGSVRQDLDTLSGNLAEARDILALQGKIGDVHRSLDATMEHIQNSQIPNTFATRARRSYQSALQGLDRRNVAKAESYARELEGVLADARSLELLADQAESVYSAIRTVSKEPAADTRAEHLYRQAEQYITAGNVTPLKSTVGEMRDLEKVLNVEYTVTHAQGPNGRRGVWRHPNDGKSRSYYEQNPSERNNYIIVHAVDANGREIPMEIRNEETGRVETVTVWAERVEFDVYQSVGRDAQDNGLIDNPLIVEEKVKGYLNAQRNHPNKGQITRW